MGIPVGSIAALASVMMLAMTAAVVQAQMREPAQARGQSLAQAQAQSGGQTPVPGSGQGAGAAQSSRHGLGQIPGGCQSPDLSKFGSDDERHGAVRSYLLCLNDENRSSEAMAGSLSRSLPPGFDSREPMVRPYDPRSGGSHRYPDDRGRGSR